MIIPKKDIGKYIDINHVTDYKLIDERWEVEERKNPGEFSEYIATDTKTTYSYYISDMFGLEQISPNEFAAFRLHDDSSFELVSFKFDRNAVIVSEEIPSDYFKSKEVKPRRKR